MTVGAGKQVARRHGGAPSRFASAVARSPWAPVASPRSCRLLRQSPASDGATGPTGSVPPRRLVPRPVRGIGPRSHRPATAGPSPPSDGALLRYIALVSKWLHGASRSVNTGIPDYVSTAKSCVPAVCGPFMLLSSGFTIRTGQQCTYAGGPVRTPADTQYLWAPARIGVCFWLLN